MKIKVLNYNIHKGRAFFSRKRTWQMIEEMLITIDPDILFMQEFLQEPQAECMLEMMADRLWPHHSFGQNATAGDYHYGNVIISKFPFVRTYNTDITNHHLEKRGLLYAEIRPLPEKSMHLFCTHLDLREQSRRKQLDKIERIFLPLAKDEPALLVGDFNDWKGKLDPTIRKKFVLDEAFMKLTGKLVATSPSLYPMLTLDRIYFRGMQVESCIALKDRALRYGSDHLPLVVEFNLL